MGILGENDYENLGMRIHSTEMFWHVLWTQDDFDDENVEAWALALYKNWWLSGCDTIPILAYNHNTRILGRAWLETYIP